MLVVTAPCITPQPTVNSLDKDIIAALEEEFKDRYTQNDPEHTAILKMKEAPPPVVPNYGYSSRGDSVHQSRNDDRYKSKQGGYHSHSNEQYSNSRTRNVPHR